MENVEDMDVNNFLGDKVKPMICKLWEARGNKCSEIFIAYRAGTITVTFLENMVDRINTNLEGKIMSFIFECAEVKIPL